MGELSHWYDPPEGVRKAIADEVATSGGAVVAAGPSHSYTFTSADVPPSGGWWDFGTPSAAAIMSWTPTESGMLTLLGPTVDPHFSTNWAMYAGNRPDVDYPSPSNNNTFSGPNSLADGNAGAEYVLAVTAGQVYTFILNVHGNTSGDQAVGYTFNLDPLWLSLFSFGGLADPPPQLDIWPCSIVLLPGHGYALRPLPPERLIDDGRGSVDLVAGTMEVSLAAHTGNALVGVSDGNAGQVLLATQASPAGAGITVNGYDSQTIALFVAAVLHNNTNAQVCVLTAGGSLRVFDPAGQELLSLTGSDLASQEGIPLGMLEVHTAGAGIVLKSPNGTRYKVTVSDAGALVVAAATGTEP
jgi:hypothetical protein